MIISIFIQFLIFIVKGCCQFIAVKIKKRLEFYEQFYEQIKEYNLLK